MKRFLAGILLGFSAATALLWEELPPTRRGSGILRPAVSQQSKAIQDEHILFGYPGTEALLHNTGYVVSHNNQKKVPYWVSYHMQEDYLWRKVERTDDFRPDARLPEAQRAELSDYRHSGYDRGHMVPADDMARSAQTMSESFLLSNITPQIGPGFNSGIWSSLENKAQKWTAERGHVWVIAGPLFLENYYVIGNGVAVPTHFFKIIASYSSENESMDAIAFLLPHARNHGEALPQFITSIDKIEEVSGLDFFHELDDPIEVALESQASPMWPV